MEGFRTKTLAAGEILFQQGMIDQEMYEVQSGTVLLTASVGDGGQTTIATLDAGKHLGVSGVVNVRPHAATAQAGPEGAVVRVISAQDFGAYFKQNEEGVMEILRSMALTLRELDNDYAVLSNAVREQKLETLPHPTPMRAMLLKVAAAWQDACDKISKAPTMG